MSTLEKTHRPPARPSWRGLTVRWIATFAGFPAGGFTAMLIVGRINSVATALVGGLITGLILGAAQAWGLRAWGLRAWSLHDRGLRDRGPGRPGPSAIAWTAATAAGLTAGLATGAALVGFGTSLAALTVQGTVCGLVLGAAQAAVLYRGLGPVAWAWPAVLAAVWSLGWAVTYAAGIAVDEQFTVFGSSGAIVVTALTIVLPVAISRTGREQS